jgi:sugar-specific transcriptional regulator TrmB
MIDDLTAIGLTRLQAMAYMHLLDSHNGEKPAEIAGALGITRTNAYKVLDQLCEYDLARKSEVGKTYRYFAEDPMALTSFVAHARNHAIELEKVVKTSLHDLQKRYHKKVRHSEIKTAYGRAALLQAYAGQVKNREDIYFVKSRMDVPFMGYDTMHRVRSEPAKFGIKRYGITAASIETPTNPEIDARTNLTRTLMSQRNYTSPVEWTVSKDEIAILNFTGNGSVVQIRDSIIADSFREIWHILDRSLRANPNYNDLTANNGRKI